MEADTPNEDKLLNHQHKMNKIYKLDKYIYDSTRHFYLPSKKLLTTKILEENPKYICDMGCGTGKILRRLNLLSNENVYLCGIDIADEMLAYAKKKSEGVFFQCAAERFSYSMLSKNQQKFDVIFFSYSLSMMPSWKAALQNAARNLSRNGKIFILDFGDCNDLPHCLQKTRFLIKKNPWSRDINPMQFFNKMSHLFHIEVTYFYGRFCYLAEINALSD